MTNKYIKPVHQVIKINLNGVDMMDIIEQGGMKFLVEHENLIPVAAEYDVVVGGGGPGGFGAAAGAARAGARTLLVERNSFLGGTATAGLMANLNISGPKLVGAAHELFYRLAEIDGAWMGRVVTFSPELMKQAALELLVEAGVNMLFYTVVCAPIVEDGVVKGVIIENKSGRQAVLSHTFIDCTGDADIAYRAGAPTNTGREDDHKMRPMSLLFRLGNINIDELVEYCRLHPEQFALDPYMNVLQKKEKVMRIEGFYDIMSEARDRGDVDENIHYLRLEGIDTENGTVIVNTVRVYNLDGTNAAEVTKGEIEARKQMLSLIKVIKEYIPGCGKAFLIDAAANLGVRETRRIIGEYVYTDEDAWYKKKYDDTILQLWRRAGLKKEMHSPDAGEGLRGKDFFDKAALYDPDLIPPLPDRDFYFPYRSLIPKEIEGMLVAGRCMSVSHFGDTWTRAIMICIACGHAAGVAAALSAKHNTGVRQVDLDELRQELKKQGVATGW